MEMMYSLELAVVTVVGIVVVDFLIGPILTLDQMQFGQKHDGLMLKGDVIVVPNDH